MLPSRSMFQAWLRSAAITGASPKPNTPPTSSFAVLTISAPLYDHLLRTAIYLVKFSDIATFLGRSPDQPGNQDFSIRITWQCVLLQRRSARRVGENRACSWRPLNRWMQTWRVQIAQLRTAWRTTSAFWELGVPDGIRTRVGAVKGRCPRPLDDGDSSMRFW